MFQRNCNRIGPCQTILISFFLCELLASQSKENEILVTVSGGILRGTLQQSKKSGRDYYAFLGIPYASIPDRFEAPVPCSAWEGIKDATKFGPVCPQLASGSSSMIVIGEEDCLFLNVFSPNVSGSLPVIVYIHGGALMTGAGSLYGGAYFLEEENDLILVTINYRLGALGFLSTGDSVIQGNAGLKDQVMALQWIRSNILSFGGDPSRVTLMGECAGSASVAYHLLSPMSKGMFHGAIMQSGSALDPEHFEINPIEKAKDLAYSLDCPNVDPHEMAECLKTTDFRSIVQIKMTKWHLDPLVEWGPALEHLREGQKVSDVFLMEDPMSLLVQGRFHRVPCVMGIMEHEGLLFHSAYVLRNLELQRNMNEDWNYVAPITFYYENSNIPPHDMNQISRTIRGYYFGNRKVAPETSTNLTNLYSDRLFNWGLRTTALLMSRWVPVYAYIFGFLGDFSMLQLYYPHLFKEPLAPTHGDDLQYFFNSTRYPNLEPNSRAEQMSRSMTKIWSAFASTGNMLQSLETLKVAWLPIGPEEIKRRRVKWCFIDIQSKILHREPFAERMDFWDKINNHLWLLMKHGDNNATGQPAMGRNETISGNKNEL